MNARTVRDGYEGKRMLSASELAKYVGLGQHSARRFAEEIGAVKHYGKRVLFDRVIIDKALDQMGGQVSVG